MNLPMRNGVAPATGRKAVFVFSDGLATNMNDAAKQATIDLCTLFRGRPDVDVYTSCYSAPGTNPGDRRAEGVALMSDCAGHSANFWEVDTARDIPLVFQKFGDALMTIQQNTPRITN